MSVLVTCMSVYYVHAFCLQRPEEAIRSLELELQMVMNYVGTEN